MTDAVGPVRLVPWPLRYALGGLVAALAAAAVFVSAAEVDRTVSATAVLLPADGLAVLRAPADGSLLELPIRAGQTVATGQSVGTFVSGLGKRSQVRASTGGVVVAVPAVPGQSVSAGSPLLTLRSAQAVTVADVFVAADSAMAVAAGQRVTITSAGFVATGQVRTVDPAAISGAAVRSMVGAGDDDSAGPTASGAHSLPAPAALVRVVHVDLDPTEKSGSVAAVGAVGTASVVLEQTTPLHLVLGGLG